MSRSRTARHLRAVAAGSRSQERPWFPWPVYRFAVGDSLSAMSEPKFPTPEELQKKLSEFMKSNFGNQVSISTTIQPDTADAGDEELPASEQPDAFEFKYLPRDIKA